MTQEARIEAMVLDLYKEFVQLRELVNRRLDALTPVPVVRRRTRLAKILKGPWVTT